jgi:type I restriction enzyme S subunit
MATIKSVSTLLVDGDWIESKDQSLEGIRLIQTGNIGIGEYLDKTNRAKYISEETLERLNCTELMSGDILISRLPDPIGRACRVPNNIGRAITAVDCTIIRLNPDKCDAEYFVQYTQSKMYQNRLSQFFAGSTRTRISRKNLEQVEIPLPSIAEQRHIALTLGKVDNLIALRKEQLAKLDELVKARFVEMFGDPASNPMHWDTKTFRQASVRLSDGPFGSNLKSEHYVQSGIRVIRLGNIGIGRFINNDQSYISEEHYEKLKKYTCKAGDIVIGTLGEPNLRACLVPETIEFAINKADCVHYVPRPEILNKYFVCQYINCPETLSLASGMVHGQTRSRISSGQLAEMPIFIPPMNLQQQFATFVEQTNKTKLTIQSSLDKLEIMKKALMQEYFG